MKPSTLNLDLGCCKWNFLPILCWPKSWLGFFKRCYRKPQTFDQHNNYELLGLWRKLRAKELMLLNCGVGEDSWKSLGQQGDPTSLSSLQSLSRVWLFETPWTATCQASLSITNSQNSPKPMSNESVMPSNHLILCRPLLLLPSIFASIRVFSNESALCMRWPKYWSFSFNTSPSNEYPGLISCRMDWLDLFAV